MTKHFSPLEILALADLENEPRLKRMAYLCRKHNMPVKTLAEAAKVIDRFGEPRGRKTVLKSELRREYLRQARIWGHRSYSKRPNSASILSCESKGLDGDITGFDPVAYKCNYFTRNHLQRCAAIVAYRFHEAMSADRADRKLTNKSVPFYSWCGRVEQVAIRWTKICGNNTYMMIYCPDWVYARGRSGEINSRLWKHSFRWLFVKQGDMVTSVRIPVSVSTGEGAIERLKSSHVRKAEKRGDIVKIDWERKLFLVRNPKRKKFRELPFKSFVRKSKKGKE